MGLPLPHPDTCIRVTELAGQNAVTWPHFRPHCAVKGIQKWPGLHTDSNNKFDFCRMLKMAVNTKPRVVFSTEYGQKLAWCGFLCCQDVIGLRMLDNAWRCTTNRRISMAWHIYALTDLGLAVIGLIWALRHGVQTIQSWLPIRFDRRITWSNIWWLVQRQAKFTFGIWSNIVR